MISASSTACFARPVMSRPSFAIWTFAGIPCAIKRSRRLLEVSSPRTLPEPELMMTSIGLAMRRLSQIILQLCRGVGFFVAIFDDDRAVDRESVLLSEVVGNRTGTLDHHSSCGYFK